MLNENLKIKQMAEDEIKKNKKDHNELTMLRETKKNLQKELILIDSNLEFKELSVYETMLSIGRKEEILRRSCKRI